jgi:hypothetical protein
LAIKKLLAAAGTVVVLVLSVVGNQHGAEQGRVAVPPGDVTTDDNTPWT